MPEAYDVDSKHDREVKEMVEAIARQRAFIPKLINKECTIRKLSAVYGY